MEILKIPFEQIPQFSKRDIAYYSESPNLRPFYKYSVQLDSFKNVIADKSKQKIDRALLVDVLKEQYSTISTTESVSNNIESLLSENAFTLITAHQPSLFTGPLYYIFKIISAINLTKTLRAHYPDNQFVPVFITGGEDHDFEEVNHLQIFNKTLTWESGEMGSVGMMSTKTIRPVLDELKNILGDSDHANKIYSIIEKAHTQNDKYADATIELANELFKEEGLVILNMNHPKLKKAFVPIIKAEIINQESHELVNQTIDKLNEVGFGAQASPREINFFYLRNQIRERIVFENSKYQVLNTNYEFTEEDMIDEIENHPERFSPNVIMRPLFQELIVPNLAYIGGGGELAYWLERKSQFEHFGINFPMLIRRNSAMWVDKGSIKKMNKFGLNVNDLAGEIEALVKEFVRKNSEGELSLNAEKSALEAIFKDIATKTKKTDPTLVKTVWAEHAKQLKSLENLENRLLKAEKQKQEISINQIRGLKDRLFPGDGLTERKENFLQYYVRYGDSFFDVLKENLHPLEKGFVVVLDS